MRFIVKKALSNFYQCRLETYYKKLFTLFFQPSMRMSGTSINFDDKKINKSNFYKNKKLFNIHDLDVNKILVSKKESYRAINSLKYFIRYTDNDVMRPLCKKIP